MADNDLALARIVEAVSRSQFWKSSAVFVLEDDVQAGPDHVDSHRSVLLVISPWAAGGVRIWGSTTTRGGPIASTLAAKIARMTTSSTGSYGAR